MRVKWVILVAVFLCSAALLGSFSSVAAAHHSQAGFETRDKAITLKGTVAEFRWRNPHVLVFWDVEGEDGEVVRWVGEFGSVSTSMSNGMTKDSLKPGDKITVTAIPSRAGNPVCLIDSLVKEDGTVISG